jgi:hypothetical protein
MWYNSDQPSAVGDRPLTTDGVTDTCSMCLAFDESEGIMTDERASKPPASRPPTDLREHRRQTERNLVVGGFVLLFVVGGGLIWYFWGLGPALAGWVCMGAGVALFGGLYLVLKLMEWWSNPRDEE